MFNYIRPIVGFIFVFISLNSLAADSPFKSNHFSENISHASDVASGDFNADGYIDIFVVSEEYRHQVYFNNPQTVFQPSDQYFSTIRGSKVITADFDNDGDLDIWVGIRSNEYDQIYLNDGSGHFDLVGDNSTNMTEPGTTYIVAGDIDNDGDIDMIRSSNSGSRYLYRNNGKGGFSEEIMSIFFTHAAMGDYDGDGFLDIWTIYGNLTVFLNDQTGHFDESREIVADGFVAGVIDITVADIDRDGDLDAQGYTVSLEFDPITGQFSGAGYLLPRYINNADETFNLIREIQQFVGSGSLNSGVLIDFDGDSDLDLWSAGIEGSGSIVAPTDENGLLDYNSALTINGESARNAVTSADFDNDGKTDVISVGLSGSINVWLNQGNFIFEAKDQPVLDKYTGLTRGLAAADFNLDGNLDYLSADSNGISLYLGNGRMNFEQTQIVSSEWNHKLVAKDFNNDGYPDFVVVGSRTELWINNQDNTFSQSETQSFDNLSYNVEAADYDQDGDQDLLFTRFFGDVLIWDNDGEGNFSLKQTLFGQYTYAQFVDMNNDGVLEILSVFRSSQSVYQLHELQDNTYVINPNYNANFSSIPTSTIFKKIQTIDWDADGDLDVITGKRNFPPNGPSTRSILINNGDEGFEVQEIVLSIPRIYAVNDINNDGFFDIIGYGNYVLINDGQNNFNSAAPNIGILNFEALLADFDNDGDLDWVSRSNEGLQNNVNTTIDRDFSGLWFNPEQSGHGLQIDELFTNGSKQIFMSWYVYQNGLPVWLSGIGTVTDNRAEVDVIITEGTGFLPDFNTTEINRIPWGTLTVDLIDKNNLNFEWNTTIEGFSSGSLPMQRITSISEAGIKPSGIRSCHSGSWYNTDQSGHGFMLEVIGSADEQRLILTWYTYLDGEQYWILAQGDIIDNKAILSADSGSGGNFPPNFDPSDVDFNPWGDITFELINDTNALISWNSVKSGFPSGQLEVSKLTYIDRYNCN